MANGLQIVETQIFNIRMLILSSQCSLRQAKFWIILGIWSFEKVTENKRLLVKYCIHLEGVLPLFIREHCSEKKNELKSSAVSKELVTNLFSWNGDGIKGIFVLFKNILIGTSMLWNFFRGYLVCLLYVRNNYFLI